MSSVRACGALIALLLFSASAFADEDRSLEASAYVLNGLPDPGVLWHTRDLMTASGVLSDVGLADPAQLPRFESARSGAIFARLIDPQNYAVLDAPGLGAEERMAHATGILSAFRTLAYIYLHAISEGVDLDREMAELTGFGLEVVWRSFRLLDALAAGMSKNDPDFAQRVEGIVTFKSGLNEIVGGSVGSLGQREVFGTQARRQLARHLQRLLPRIVVFLPPVQRTDTQMLLQTLGREEGDENVRALIAQIRRELPAN